MGELLADSFRDVRHGEGVQVEVGCVVAGGAAPSKTVDKKSDSVGCMETSTPKPEVGTLAARNASLAGRQCRARPGSWW